MRYGGVQSEKPSTELEKEESKIAPQQASRKLTKLVSGLHTGARLSEGASISKGRLSPGQRG